MSKKRISNEVFQQLLIPSTATLTSALKQLGLSRSFIHGVAPLRPNMKMAGPAFTLRYIPAREDLNAGEVDNMKDVQRIAIEEIGVGEVFVIDARGDTRAGTMGDILATRLFKRGAAGVVTDGAFRDSPAIAEIGIPAFAAAMNAHSNKTVHHPSEIQVPIACGEVAVLPGDIIVGDAEGVVAIPIRLAEEAAQIAVEMEMREKFILKKIQSGASIVGSYPPDESTLAEYKVWKNNNKEG
ncbi:MAG: ribonuclease activity regulator RraA [Candidatus Poribacteria bacterium]|nr:ribonuclease activity regulator RraA [Candidatus Poribacteria bacterium]